MSGGKSRGSSPLSCLDGLQEAFLEGSILVDSPTEILANKLCTLLSRAELRDLVDVKALEEAGYSIEEILPAAAQKDGGLTPAQLAWVLSQIRIGEDAKPPGDVTAVELKDYLELLISRLTRLAHPETDEVGEA